MMQCFRAQLTLPVLAHYGSGGSPFASACAALLPERVEGLLLVCPLAPCFGREQELHEGLGPHSKRFFAMLNSAPWAARVQMAAVRQVRLSRHRRMVYGGQLPVSRAGNWPPGLLACTSVSHRRCCSESSQLPRKCMW